MKKVRWFISLTYERSRYDGELEFPDNATPDEMEKAAMEEAFSWVDWSYEVEDVEE